MAKTTKTGRPISLDSVKANQVIELLKSGHYMQTALEVAGMPRSTVYAWMNGTRAQNSRKIQDFVDTIKKANAEAEQALVQVVRTAALGYTVERVKQKFVNQQNEQGEWVPVMVEQEIIRETKRDWQAAMTILERRWPDRCGRRPPTINHEENEVTSEDLPEDFL